MSNGSVPPSGRPVPAGLIGWACVVAGAIYVAVATESPQPSGIAFHRPFWLFLWLLGASALWARNRRLSPAAALATCAIAAMLVTADAVLTTVPLRDLHLGLSAGERFLAGAPVYPAAVVPPIDPANFPFVYPPPVLLAFGFLARLPEPVAVVAYMAALVGATLVAARMVGLSWRWSALLLLWTPVFEGLWVGNVAGFTWLLFAAAPWVGSGLVLAGVAKLFAWLTALWLVREGRFRSLLVGAAALLVVAALTLPLVGVDRWVEWFRGLGIYQRSASAFQGAYSGIAFWVLFPTLVTVAAAIAATASAVALRGREGLAAFGTASVLISGSVHSHGFLTALPAFLLLRAPLCWLLILMTSVPPSFFWWLSVPVALGGLLLALRHPVAVVDSDHPLGAAEAWPLAPLARRPA